MQMNTITSKLLSAAMLMIVAACESDSQKNQQQKPALRANAAASLMDSIQLAHGKSVYTVYGRKSDGYLLVEDDMLFPLPSKDKGRQGLTGVITANVWPTSQGRIIVPYTLNSNVDTTTGIGKHIMDGMRMWRRLIPVQFRARTDADANYVEFFVNQTKSSSFVGCINQGMQKIKLENSRATGTVAHEIGHLLGLYHEQNRGDRDEFITIAANCLKNKNYRLAFDKDPTAEDREPYNYYSIMHYPVNECITIKPTGVPAGTTLPNGVPGQRDSIAVSDVEALLYTYRLGNYQQIP